VASVGVREQHQGAVCPGRQKNTVPVLKAILHQFPFQILRFHSDNGSEFINRSVAQLLEKLRIEFTKTRANRTQDIALVEGKNGAIVRKHIGYGHVAGEHAEEVQKCYTALNPYLLELSSPLRLRHSESGCARQAAAEIQAAGLPHAVRDVAILLTGRTILGSGSQLRTIGHARSEAE
jgi:transposase InsO family protein